ncbi:MAG: DUF3667 domain-containing protein [Bacteroidota bacterium]
MSVQPDTYEDASTSCTNCGAPLGGAFCAQCGQQAESPIKPFRRFVADLFRDHFSLDTRFVHTLHHLFTRPGHLTRAYLEGHRARYLPPLRLYLICSFLMFFGMAILDVGIDNLVTISGDDDHALTQADSLRQTASTLSTTAQTIDSTSVLLRLDAIPMDAAAATLDSATVSLAVAGETLRALASSLDPTDAPAPQPEDSTQESATGHSVTSFLERRLDEGAENASKDESGFMATVIERTPIMMFTLQPISALLLMLLYFRQKRLYAEHFIFSLHVHAFAYLLTLLLLLFGASRITTLVGISVDTWSDLASLIVIVVSSIYLFLAQRRMYQQSRRKTLVKYVLFGVAYLVIWAIAFALVIIITILTS